MTTLRRFQVDLTEVELSSIERLGTLASLRTKKDVILNAIALFRWAANEILHGRTICSVDEKTQVVKQLELPSFATIADKRIEPLTEGEIRQRDAEGTRSFSEFRPNESNEGEGNVPGIVEKFGNQELGGSVGSRSTER